VKIKFWRITSWNFFHPISHCAIRSILNCWMIYSAPKDAAVVEKRLWKKAIFQQFFAIFIVHFDFSSGLTLLVANQRQTRQKRDIRANHRCKPNLARPKTQRFF
jgi:uncharacterized membrane protein